MPVNHCVQHGVRVIGQRDTPVDDRKTVLHSQITVSAHVVNAGQDLIQAGLEVSVRLDIRAEHGGQMVEGERGHITS